MEKLRPFGIMCAVAFVGFLAAVGVAKLGGPPSLSL